jgi:hypothetical protein
MSKHLRERIRDSIRQRKRRLNSSSKNVELSIDVPLSCCFGLQSCLTNAPTSKDDNNTAFHANFRACMQHCEGDISSSTDSSIKERVNA